MASRRGFGRAVIGIGISIVALFLVVRSVDLAATWNTITSAQPQWIVVMLHPDYQYDATRIPQLVAPILSGDADLMLGSRFLGDPLAGGMPKWKFVSNRFLTGLENRAFGLHLSEYHTGLRAYSRRLLETIPYSLNSDDFVFDQELVAQVVAVGGLRIGEIAVPTRYFEEASSVGFKRSVVYGLSTLRVVGAYLLHRSGIRRSAKLRARSAVRESGTA